MKKILLIIFILMFSTVVLAAALFNDGFESGDTSAWSSELDAEGDLTVTEVASLHGTYGMNLLIDNTTAMHVRDNTPVAETRYRFRFYIDPNGLTMADNDEFFIFAARDNSFNTNCSIKFNYTTANGYRIKATDRADGAWDDTQYYIITDMPHCIEIDWKASSFDGADDGMLELYIDDVLKETLAGVDSDTGNVEDVRMGATSGIDAGTSGTFYLDDFASNDDGTLIGQIGDNAIFFGCNF